MLGVTRRYVCENSKMKNLRNPGKCVHRWKNVLSINIQIYFRYPFTINTPCHLWYTQSPFVLILPFYLFFSFYAHQSCWTFYFFSFHFCEGHNIVFVIFVTSQILFMAVFVKDGMKFYVTFTRRGTFFSLFLYEELVSLRSLCEWYCTTSDPGIFIGSTPTIETLEKDVTYVQS